MQQYRAESALVVHSHMMSTRELTRSNLEPAAHGV
jgi:hypothetical protein